MDFHELVKSSPDSNGQLSNRDSADTFATDNDEIDLPPFASEETKQLNKEIRLKQRLLKQAILSTADQESRSKILSEHLENVKQEISHTQRLIDAKKKQYETENHMMKLNTREKSRIVSSTLRLRKEIEKCQDRSNTTMNDIYKGNEKLDQFKLEMNWNQEELQQWALVAKQKEEDNVALERYKKTDDAKLRESTLAVEKLTMEVHKVKAALNKEITETQAVQIELDRTAENFKEIHNQREAIIRQWEEGVSAMRKRDEAIADAGRRYANAQEELSQKQQDLDKMKAFLAEHAEANGELQSVIAVTERQLKRQRIDFMNEKQQLNSLEDETEVLRNQLSAETLRNALCSSKLASMSEIVEENKAKYNAHYQKYSQTNVKLEKEIRNASHKDQLTEATEKFYNKMENAVKETEAKLKKLKGDLFKQAEDLFSLKAEEATTLGDISGTQATIKALKGQLQKLELDSQHQQELLYAVDFQSQLMQRKVARVCGERTVEEKEELNRKLNLINARYEEQKGLWFILSKQAKQLEAELRVAQRDYSVVEKENTHIEKAIDDLKLEIESIQKAYQTELKANEETLVSQNGYKLEVAFLRDNLVKITDSMLSAENAKTQLRLTVQEKEKEIEIETEMLKAQMRAADEDRHSAALQLADRNSKVNNYEAKYKTVLQKSKKEEGTEEHSQAYYVIKAAQEQEELQRQGDELDANINKAEREIKALENTLNHLVVRNHRYKENLKQVDITAAKEAQEKERLEEEIATANELAFWKKKQLASSELQLQAFRTKYSEANSSNADLEKHLEKLCASKEQTKNEIEAQSNKASRAFRQLQKSKRLAAEKSLTGTMDQLTQLQVETQLETVKDQNLGILYALSMSSQAFTETLSHLQQLLEEKGLIIPTAALTSYFKNIGKGCIQIPQMYLENKKFHESQTRQELATLGS